jgi:hypothetical protein
MFDPETAYQGDYQWMNFVQEATYEQPMPSGESPIRIDGCHVRIADITSPEFTALTVGLGITSSTTAFLFWNSTDAEINPRPGDVLILADERWAVQNMKRSVFGYWQLACEKEPDNAAA